MHTFLHHYVNHVLFVALQDDAEQQQCRLFFIRESSLPQQCHLVPYQEVPARIHHCLCENIRRSRPIQQRRIQNAYTFQSEWVGFPESEEFQVDFAKLDVEFTEVRYVLSEHFLEEVTFDELRLERVLRGAQ